MKENEERMGIGERQNEDTSDSSQNEKKHQSMTWGYKAVCDGACSEYPPVPGKFICFHLLFVKVAINIIVENESRLKTKEPDQGNPEEIEPGEVSVNGRRQQVA